MEPINSIEEKLARLIPPALSEEGQTSMEDLIDELAGVEADDHSGMSSKPWLWKVAAAVAILAVPVVMIQQRGDSPAMDTSLARLDTDVTLDVSPEMMLLKSIKMIDARENDGLIVPNDGSAPHYRYRYRVIDEEVVKDPETGVVITLRQPRQEIVTIPVTQF